MMKYARNCVTITTVIILHITLSAFTIRLVCLMHSSIRSLAVTGLKRVRYLLVELLKKHHYDLHRMAHEETTAEVLNSIDSTSDNPIPVIYQSTRRCNR